tara:strand:- start:570 stop:728 length:159 start_codon:yes stop_codon:yes gene_type:complete
MTDETIRALLARIETLEKTVEHLRQEVRADRPRVIHDAVCASRTAWREYPIR